MLMLCSSVATSSNLCCITLLCVGYMYSICADLLHTPNVAQFAPEVTGTMLVEY